MKQTLLKKQNAIQNLDKEPVLYIDEKNEIFNVICPEVLPSGKTILKIAGSDLLKVTSEVKCEIIDSEKNVIYTEFIDYLVGSSRIISAHIYPDVSYGVATLTVIGEMKDVPTEWQNRPNVKYTTKILVDPNLRNEQPILFNKTPRLLIYEEKTPYKTQTYANNEITSSFSEGKISGKLQGQKFLLNLSGSNFSHQMKNNGIINVPTIDYTTKINKILTNKTIEAISPYSINPETNKNYDDEIFRILDRNNTTNFDYSDFTLTYNTEPTFSQTENYKSMIKAKITDMSTFSGEIEKISLYQKSMGDPNNLDYSLIGSEIIDTKEILVDTSGISNINWGVIINQQTIDNYWTVSNGNLIFDNVNIFNAMKSSGSNYELNENYTISTQNNINFSKNSEYLISMDLYTIPQLKKIADKGREKIKNISILKIYASGSAFISNNKSGKLIQEIEVTNTKEIRDYGKSFLADQDGTGKIIFTCEAGQWNFSEISLKPTSELGFSPSEIELLFPFFDWQRNDNVLFKASFFNYKGDEAEIYVTGSEIGTPFSGSNFYLDGTDNMISGSVFISNTLNKGVEISGISSAIIRSVDYSGWHAANSGTGSGFILYSGSLPDLDGDYEGVGLELHSGGPDPSALRFSTKDQRLQLTGSLFLKGDSYISGTISCSEGWIGGWTINPVALKSPHGMVMSGSGVIKTAETGQRIELNGLNNTLNFYKTSITDPIITIDDNIWFFGYPGIKLNHPNAIIYFDPGTSNEEASIKRGSFFAKSDIKQYISHNINNYTRNIHTAAVCALSYDSSSNIYGRNRVGVHSTAVINQATNNSNVIAIYGNAVTAGSGNAWSAYFENGNTKITEDLYVDGNIHFGTNIIDKHEITGSINISGSLVSLDGIKIIGSLDVTDSTRFGNSLDDIHRMTGSFQQTGSGATSYFMDKLVIGKTNSDYAFEIHGENGKDGNPPTNGVDILKISGSRGGDSTSKLLDGGSGGCVHISSGGGGNSLASGDSGETGGSGGSINIEAGRGGSCAGSALDGGQGGPGGSINLIGKKGGDGSDGDESGGNAGAGSDIVLQSGDGGDGGSSPGLDGAGGNPGKIFLLPGNPGSGTPPGNQGLVSINDTTPNTSYTCWIDGNLGLTGTVSQNVPSDIRLKNNVKVIGNALDKINQLRGVRFTWNEKAPQFCQDMKKPDVGIIAQEAQQVLPESISIRNDGYLGLQYEKFIPLLLEAIKEQDLKIKKLEKKLDTLIKK